MYRADHSQGQFVERRFPLRFLGLRTSFRQPLFDPRPQPLFHFARRLVRERDRQQLTRCRFFLFEQGNNAFHQHTCFSRAGTRGHANPTVGFLHCRLLLQG